MPKKSTPKRNYKREYKKFQSSKLSIAQLTKRNKARSTMSKLGLVKKGDGKHVDHIKPLSKGGSNGRMNLRVVKAKTNLKKGKK